MMKKLILAAALTAAFSGLAHAEEPKPDNEVSFNVAVTSDYRYRGISQTRTQPALQGGVDYVNNPTGFYLGTWLSSIKWIKDAGGGANVEQDVYGGFRGEFANGVSWDLGVLTYIYSGNDLKPSANTTEGYVQVGYGPAYAKYSYSTTNLFGFADSKNSGYIDVGANFDVAEGTQLNLHVGRQTVKGSNGLYSYTDYKFGFTKDFGVVSGSIAVIGTNTDAYVGPASDAKNLGKAGLVVSVSKVF